jgi:hypothetical protein
MTNAPPTIIKTYRSKTRYEKHFLGLVVVIFSIVLLSLLIQGEIQELIGWLPIALFFILVSILIFISNRNQQPDISTTESGLFISHNFGRLFLPWKSITLVRERKNWLYRTFYIYSNALPWSYLGNNVMRPIGRAFMLNPTFSREEMDEIISLVEVNSDPDWNYGWF